MDISQMEYLIATVEEETLTHAAQKLHITQPALSRSIMRMEESVGIPLFNRVGRNITVNKYGELLYQWAKKSVTEYHKTVKQINVLLENDSNTITIGCSGYVYSMPIIMGFQKTYPHIMLNNFKFNRRDFPDIIYQSSVDCILSVIDFSAEDADSILLYHGPLFAALPSSHRLSKKTGLHLEEIKNERLIMSAGDTLFHESVEEMYRHINAIPLISNKVETSHLISMITEGMGCSIINTETVNMISKKTKKCVCIPLEDDFCFTSAYLIWNKKSHYSESFSLFQNYLKQRFQTSQQS